MKLTPLSSPRRLGRWLPVVVCTLASVYSPLLRAGRPMEVADLLALHRLSDGEISPDGKWVSYTVSTPVIAENTSHSQIWLAPVAGGPARQVTNAPKHDRHARWSPDGKWILFESDRDGSTQLWVMPASGGDATKLTSISTEASQGIWSPDGKSIAFVSAVNAEFSDRPFAESDRLNREKAEAKAKSKVKARIFTSLLYRHWDSWVGDLRQHLFVVAFNDGKAGEPKDVTPGDRDAVPTSSTFSQGDDFAFSADSKVLAYSATPFPVREGAWSTNMDILSVNLATGEHKPLTTNPAADIYPRYSPDGKWLAYVAQARAGFEADRWQLILLNLATHERHSLTEAFDHSVSGIVWAPDSSGLYFEAGDNAEGPLYFVGLAGGEPRKLVAEASNSDLSVSRDGKTLVYGQASFTKPVDFYALNLSDSSVRRITKANETLMASLDLPTPESVTVAGAGGTPVQMWILKPPGFDPAKKYPLVFWVHGGPQSVFSNNWSFRWNPEVWAAQGYVVSLANPRGSVSFGQKFTDEISRNWGSKPYDDLMACLAYLKTKPYIDGKHMAAAGASYGGYMMNWFQGHTDQFRAIVTHDGVYNFESMYGATDELWFEEWEHGVPWKDADFAKYSPNHYAANFKTPNLIIHNELDFRVPIDQGEQLFALLQRKGIPSKFLSFPDEGHWVLKPQNSELWHKTIFDWLATYLK